MQIWQQLIHAAAVLSLRYEAQGKFREEERCAGATVVVTSSWEKKCQVSILYYTEIFWSLVWQVKTSRKTSIKNELSLVQRILWVGRIDAYLL